MIGKKAITLGLCFLSMRLGAIEVALAMTDLAGNHISRVVQGEYFLIQVIVSGDQQGLGEPIITHLDTLSQVVRHPVSTHITITNGQQSVARTYVYKARLDNIGEWSLGPAFYDLGGQVVRSSALTFSVVKGQASALAASTDPFVHVHVHKLSAYVSEQVLVQVHVGYKKAVEQIALEPWTVTNGRIIQLADPVQEHFFYDGRSWPCVTYTYALYPARAGECVIPELRVYGEREKEDARGSFISHFFFGRERERITAQSKPVVLQVKPFPHGIPTDVCVGEFSRLNVQVDKKEIEPGTAATLIVTLVGNGDMQHGVPYTVFVPDGLKMYESKTSYTLEQPLGFIARKQEFIVQALHDGTFVIEPPLFSFFNPVTQKRETLHINKLMLTAKKGATINRSEYARENTGSPKSKKWPVLNNFWLILIASSLVLTLFVWYLKRAFQPFIEKKMAYFTFRRRVKKAHRTRDVQSLHAAWFLLFNERLGVSETIVSLREAGKFLDVVARERWHAYVSKLEYAAFQARDVLPFLDDVIMQTYEWISVLEDVL